MNHKLILKAVFLTLFLVVAVLLTIWAFPKVMELKDPAVREMYKNEVENMGFPDGLSCWESKRRRLCLLLFQGNQ